MCDRSHSDHDRCENNCAVQTSDLLSGTITRRSTDGRHCSLRLLVARSSLERISIHHGSTVLVGDRPGGERETKTKRNFSSFSYVYYRLEQLVTNDYVLIYFHGATPKHRTPDLKFLRKCYQMINFRSVCLEGTKERCFALIDVEF